MFRRRVVLTRLREEHSDVAIHIIVHRPTFMKAIILDCHTVCGRFAKTVDGDVDCHASLAKTVDEIFD